MDKILKLFFEEPHKEFHVREIARILKKSPTTISKYLKEYQKKGILISEKKLGHLLFKANVEDKNFRNKKLNYNLSLLNNSGLMEFLEEWFNYPKAIVLFGSFAKSENIKKSDVDLLIISSKKEMPLREIKKYESKIGHEIQLFIHSPDELKKLRVKNKELFNNWINGIVIHGYFEGLK